MGFKDFFKKDKKDRLDPLADLVLSKMKKGYFVDYDMKTWEVTAANHYDFGAGGKSYEWQLKSDTETVYLELEIDDEEFWSLSRKIAFPNLGPEIKEAILADGDPPQEITYNETTFYLDETSGGQFFKDGQDPGKDLLRWSYYDDPEEQILEIEQWGEQDFEASLGREVEEWQFENILPREV